MARVPFERLVDSGLLNDVEEIVVSAYLSANPGASRPAAYRWLRYEDPAPVARLAEGVEKLAADGVRFDPEAVDKACAKARNLGFLN